MSIELSYYGYMYYGTENGKLVLPQVGDLITIPRYTPDHSFTGKAGVIVKVIQPAGLENSGKYAVAWTDGKRTTIQGNSLLRLELIVRDAEDFYMRSQSLLASARQVKELSGV